MRKILVALWCMAAVTMFTACGGGSNKKAADGTTETAVSSSGKRLVTDDMKTGEGTKAREDYYAETVREEFTFDKSGTLTNYKIIYTFIEGADKEKALDFLSQGNQKASIDGNTLVIDGNGNYSGLPYKSTNLDKVKAIFDEKGRKYTIK